MNDIILCICVYNHVICIHREYIYIYQLSDVYMYTYSCHYTLIEIDDDRTGDSGMGTGSTQYGDVNEWKQAIRYPPPATGMSVT